VTPAVSDSSSAPSRMPHVLLVDDDEIDVLNVRRAFEHARITSPLWVANDGLEALAMLRGDQLPPGRRLVLLDLNMPRMNGLELLRELRADPALQRTPVVMLTSSDDARDVAAAYQLNVAGYLRKPATFAASIELMAALMHYWTQVEMP